MYAKVGTKSPLEKEEDDAQRLVRPAPKQKPPRRDSRRERLKIEDSDTETQDPDLSLNYKNIGGSMRDSFFTEGSVMRHNALYHGVDPYTQGEGNTVSYIPWQQGVPDEFGPTEKSELLAVAKKWLKEPSLLHGLDQGVLDIKYRAALDLAIKTWKNGAWSGSITPTNYNELLRSLMNAPEGTLLTKQSSESVYQTTRNKDTHSMKRAAKEIRDLAKQVVASHPVVAYDLMALADRVAQQQSEEPKEESKEDSSEKEQTKKEASASAYASLKSALIRTAHENPAAQATLMPLLKLVKSLG